MSLPRHIDAIIRQLENSGNRDLKAMPYGERRTFIGQQVEKALNQYRIDAVPDMLLFCTLALAGKDFDREPRVAHALDRALKEGVPFGRAYWQDFTAQEYPASVQGRGGNDTSCC